jgi:hypothetical protein
MKKKLLAALALALGVCAFTGPANAQFLDTFDSYAVGPLAAQSTWEEWYTSSGVDASVSTAFAFTGTKSAKIVGTPTQNDVVYPFSTIPGGRPSSGAWLMSAKTYIPSSESGLGYFIMLNTYNDPSAGADNWSLQIRFNLNQQFVRNDGPLHGQATLIRDKWVNLRAWIDLTGDKVDLFYGDSVLATGQSWTGGLSGSGLPRIDVVDLFGGQGTNAVTGMYYDNVSLQQVDAYAVITNAAPNPVFAGNTIALTTIAPELPNSTAALFVWDVNGIPAIHLLATHSLDIAGKWSLSGPVPTGLGGLNINFKSLVVGPAGGTIEGASELVLFK